MSEINKAKPPYYDDFSQEKGYYEVLFRPRFAVQTRELNQIQSMFNTQIDRIGSHIFKNGSMVLPGNYKLDNKVPYAKLSINDYSSVRSALQQQGLTAVNENTGKTANVVLVLDPEGDDPITAYLDYGSQGTDTSQFFDDNVVLKIKNPENDIDVVNATVLETGRGSVFFMNAGVFFVNGRFVYTESQNHVVSKYSQDVTASVGFDYKESIVTENDDPSLVDNANGSPNFSAPGAHRLAIDLTANSYPVDDQPSDFIEILRVENAQIKQEARTPDYSVLGDEMAKRTYEESGNYAVEPFKVDVLDHLKGPGRDGILTEAEGGREDLYVVEISEGLAYVQGHRVKLPSSYRISIDKARDTKRTNNAAISAAYGYYIEVSDLNSIPSVNDFPFIEFYDDVPTNPGEIPQGTKIGTANIRAINIMDTNEYRLYIFNTRNMNGRRDSGFIQASKSIYGSSEVPYTGIVDVSAIQDTDNNSLVFSLPNEFTKTLLDDEGNTDTSYSVLKKFSGTLDTEGDISFTVSSNQTFVSIDDTVSYGVYTDTGEVLSLSSYELGGNPVGSSISFSFGASNSGRPIRLNLRVVKQTALHKNKILTETTETGTFDGNTLELQNVDAVELISVIDSDDNDVTDRATLYSNQTANYYGKSIISGSAGSLFNETVTVTYKYYDHSSGDYFSVDSYQEDYQNIPNVVNAQRATDVLDFRPASTGTNSFETTTEIPVPDSLIRFDTEYYLARIDKLYVKFDGSVRLRKGISAIDPDEPGDVEESMTVAVMDVPPYTFNASDIDIVRKNNRHYTMKDIRQLDERIRNVEYYVALNNLERETANQKVTDPVTGLDRFKSGFLVDGFADHSVGDYTWEDYHVSVGEALDGPTLRPEFTMNAVDLEFNSDLSSNVVENDGIITLPYTEKTYFSQLQASGIENVNPFAYFRWDGSIKLDPSEDNWIDVTYQDPKVTYSIYNNGNLSQTWDAWGLTWTEGVTTSSSRRSSSSTSSSYESVKVKDIPGASSEYSQFGDWYATRKKTTTRRRTTVTTTTTRTDIDVVDDKLMSSSVIPYMRSREVEVTAEAMRPNTKMYFFFDRNNVTEYVRPVDGDYGDDVISDDNGDFVAIYKLPNNEEDRFKVGTRLFVAQDDDSGQIENSLSHAWAYYTAHGTHQQRLQTILATRNITTSSRSYSSSSTSRSGFATTGTPHEETNGYYDDPWDHYLISDEPNSPYSTKYLDPLAQSFLIQSPGGSFLTSVELFFSNKDSRYPVSVEIRAMENGYPSDVVVPGSKVTLKPSLVNTSLDASEATKFTFDYPIYLKDDTEYCFVVSTKSSTAYFVHVANMGEKNINTDKYIVKQPFAGVMFKSQNNKTWTAAQESDLMFRINRAEFDTSTSGTCVLENIDIEDVVLPANPFVATEGSTKIEINRKGHNYLEGEYIIISNAVGNFGISDSTINGSFYIESVDVESVIIDVGVQANQSGSFGGNQSTVSESYMASMIHLNIPEVILGDTDISYQIRGVRGQSFDGSEPAYQTLSNYNVQNRTNVFTGTMWKITNEADEQQNNSGNKSLVVTAQLSSGNKYISPVLDEMRANVITPCFILNHDGTETPPADGEGIYAKYRSQVGSVQNEATALKAFLEVSTFEQNSVFVSYRVGNSEEEIEQADWNALEVRQTIPSSGEYTETEFFAEDIQEFTRYQVMIFFRGRDMAAPPFMKNLRVIALGT